MLKITAYAQILKLLDVTVHKAIFSTIMTYALRSYWASGDLERLQNADCCGCYSLRLGRAGHQPSVPREFVCFLAVYLK
jgi:hypothetical protein